MNTILITVDALRADHLEQYGYHRDTMPVLERLVEDGTIFTEAYANGPYTRISVPSFHTSRYLAYDRLGELPTISSTLSKAGVHTACIGTRTGFHQYEGGLTFDEFVDLGRDEYHTESNETFGPIERTMKFTRSVAQRAGGILPKSNPLYGPAKDAYYTFLGEGFEYKGYTSAETVTDTATEWLNDHDDGDFFLWLHYMEGHRPYGVHDDDPTYHSDVSEAYIRELMKKAGTEPESVTDSERETLVDLYDSDLRYCSRHLSRLFDELVDLGQWDETAILFTSDHGEEFADHGKYFHRNLPYNELLHVPLIAAMPGYESDSVDDQRELLDLAPTICNFHGTDEPSAFLGQNLFEGSSRDIIAVGAQCSRDPVVACQRDEWKYISNGKRTSLFDLKADPNELTDVADENATVVRRFERVIPNRLFDLEPERLDDAEDEVDREHLEALGYLELEE